MGDSSPSFSTIKKWAAEFKCGRTSLEDDNEIRGIAPLFLYLGAR
jgi:hypothetical protein